MKLKKILVAIVPCENDQRTLEGIAAYNHSVAWRLRIADISRNDINKVIQKWRPDGIIFNGNRKLKISPNIPLISLFRKHPGVVSIFIDDEKIGEDAANYFLDKNFKHFAFITGNMRESSKIRYAQFKKTIEHHNLSSTYYESKCEYGIFASSEADDLIAKMAQWLKRQSFPLAVHAFNDCHALQVIEACHQANLSVPDHVAVLGFENDTHVSLLSTPHLSSIRMPFREIGQEAARLLHRQLEGKKVDSEKESKSYLPCGIEERWSTEIINIDDVSVVKALKYVRAHRSEPLKSATVIHASGVSKTLLLKKFKQYLKRSPLQEIHKQKMDLAAELLKNSSMNITEVGECCGIRDVVQFSKLFKKYWKKTPVAYRKSSFRELA